METNTAVEMVGISKKFGGVQALDGVDFEVRKGEIHALLGGNGAGKSTILKVLNGIHQPDHGTIKVDGKPLYKNSPEAAAAAGIAMNFQELSLIPTLSVAKNVFLAREPRTANGLIDDKETTRRAQALFDMLEVSVDPSAIVGDLGAGQKQLTEIVKAISKGAKVLILDEPSTALAVTDVDRLFIFLRKLKTEGVAIIYVSHRMDEIARIADRATILRDGKHVITDQIKMLPTQTMIEFIVGKRSKGLADVQRGHTSKGEVLLELCNVAGTEKPNGVSLTVHRGEIVGLAGLLGSGRSSVARLIAGLQPSVAGDIYFKGQKIKFVNAGDSIRTGIVMVPESRATEGIIPDHSVVSNMTLAILDRISRWGLIKNAEANIITENQIEKLGIKTASKNHKVSTLSGGNQQKVVIGKWLATDPEVLVLDEPTAGIDVGSKSEIVGVVRDLARQGKGVLMISSELPELLTACDRIVIMAEGRSFYDLSRDFFDDPEDPNRDPSHLLEKAEQQLQAYIQLALTAQNGETNELDQN
ncbi:MAG: sugar ABC transporter ATP-binding protein [Flavobacteriales bacterium]|nr:sugar ABC transporter ATP-binding protein [Flavobacteriales bacterium]